MTKQEKASVAEVERGRVESESGSSSAYLERRFAFPYPSYHAQASWDTGLSGLTLQSHHLLSMKATQKLNWKVELQELMELLELLRSREMRVCCRLEKKGHSYSN